MPVIGWVMQGTDDLQQLAGSYPKSPLNEDHLTGVGDRLTGRGARAGERAPEAEAEVVHAGRTTSLFPYLYNPDRHTRGWALPCFDGHSPDAAPPLAAAIEVMVPWGSVRPRLVLAGPLCVAGDTPVLSDLDRKAHAAYGPDGRRALVLVRLIGHIAFRVPAAQPERLTAYCSRVFGIKAGARITLSCPFTEH